VTLFGALPIYAQFARRSYPGQGSIAMLENLLPGWSGKLLVRILLGFAATDFVITMTLSAADATKHAIEKPYLHPFLGDAQIGVTLILLALLAVVFLFRVAGADIAAIICTSRRRACPGSIWSSAGSHCSRRNSCDAASTAAPATSRSPLTDT
jgi:hypothetical protein